MRETGDNFQLLAANISDALWVRSADLGELFYVSPGFERIWGRPVAELYSKPGRWIEFVLPSDQARVAAAFAAFIGEDRALDLEYCIVRPSGEVRWVHVRGFKARDAEGRPIRLVGIVSDITEKRRVEQALRESEEQMRLRTTALDAAANAVLITDRTGTIQWVNAAFTRLTGYTPAEALGRNPRLLKSGQQSQSMYRQMWDTICRGEVWHGEVINRRKDGQFYQEDMTITPVRDGAGEIAQFIAIKQDISERKRAEASIHDLHRKLLAASRQAGMADVAIDVLHNVGNVLNSVNVSANLLEERVRDSRSTAVAKLAALLSGRGPELADFLSTDEIGQKIPEYVSTLAEALAEERAAMLAELGELRKNIQHITEIVARQETLACVADVAETFVATEMVEDALRIEVDALTGRDIAMLRDYRTRARVTVDRHKATQILMNIVANARRACIESGRSDKQILARVTCEAGRVEIAVTDNGVGIAAEQLEEIFGQQYPNRRDGAGSGLHASAMAAVELGGALRAHSEGLGRGATFVLELPGGADAAGDEGKAEGEEER